LAYGDAPSLWRRKCVTFVGTTKHGGACTLLTAGLLPVNRPYASVCRKLPISMGAPSSPLGITVTLTYFAYFINRARRTTVSPQSTGPQPTAVATCGAVMIRIVSRQRSVNTVTDSVGRFSPASQDSSPAHTRVAAPMTLMLHRSRVRHYRAPVRTSAFFPIPENVIHVGEGAACSDLSCHPWRFQMSDVHLADNPLRPASSMAATVRALKNVTPCGRRFDSRAIAHTSCPLAASSAHLQHTIDLIPLSEPSP